MCHQAKSSKCKQSWDLIRRLRYSEIQVKSGEIPLETNFLPLMWTREQSPPWVETHFCKSGNIKILGAGGAGRGWFFYLL